MDENVIAFEPRRAPAPSPLRFAEVRLDDDCGIELTLCDDHGPVAVLQYVLANRPNDFDLALLRRSWAEWRGRSAEAL